MAHPQPRRATPSPRTTIRPVRLFGQAHADRYLATNGAEGHEWEGTQTLLLTTIGRRSGEPRVAPLIYAPAGDAFAIVASKGGSEARPAWYVNLSANPDVEVQIKGERFTARARTATVEEKAELWPTMVAEWPRYDEYQAKTDREIPIVLLERA